MATIKPFRAIRPAREYAERVAALPYDVMDSDEARAAVQGNPWSFLHVDKAEIDLDPSIDPHDERVYDKAWENLENMRSAGVLTEDEKECYYIYRQTMDGRSQTGLVCCASVSDYLDGRIKKHELTRADKEADRIRHVDRLDANTGPIFLSHRPRPELGGMIGAWAGSHEPVYDFTSDDGVGHTVWTIDDPAVISNITSVFLGVEFLYIADGHHRCASAARVGQMRKAADPGHMGGEEYNFFLAAIFPSDQLRILDYNRVVRDLNGYSAAGLLAKIGERFAVEECGGPVKPERKHVFGMFLDGRWHRLTARDGTYDESDPVGSLDVSILQRELLAPILDVGDPRTDNRIDFVGGVRGLTELEERTRRDMRIAFSLYPTSIEDLMAIADAGLIMPPKSTWFEPKLRSGLFIHRLEAGHIGHGG